jgi:hypothetical protein
MFGKSKESTVIQPKVLRIAHWKDFPTLKFGFTAVVIWILPLGAKMTDVYNELNMELLNGIKAAESPKNHVPSTAPNVPVLIPQILKRYDTD